MIIKLFLTTNLLGSFLAGFNKETNQLEKRTPMELAWSGKTDDPEGLNLGELDPKDFVFGEDIDGKTSDLLAAIFRRFNIDHPTGYKNRSLSVGDMVSINGHNYLCQPVGWKYLGAVDLPDDFLLGE